jgi:tetratricopeptide (TPR) repeat protein
LIRVPSAPTTALILTIAVGCGSRQPARSAPERESGEDSRDLIRLDPIHVKAVRDEERLVIEAYDASGLFDRGAENLRKGRCGDAVTIYRRLASEFPDSRFASPSLYNSGLCNEQLERFEEAVSDYTSLIEKYPDSRDVTDAMFRLAGAYEKLEAWEDSASMFTILLTEREDLEGMERIEALARKGSCLINLEKSDEARVVLDEAIALFGAGRDLPPSASTYYFAMACFKIGEIVQAEMRRAELPADETVLEAALDKKCQLLLDAQGEYTKTIKIGHPHWAAAAAYRIGNLYRGLWDDMMAAPVPEDLNDEEKEIYLEVLKNRIRVLLKKATRQWERTLKMARRLNLSNEWVERTGADLEEIREIMDLEQSSEDEDEDKDLP